MFHFTLCRWSTSDLRAFGNLRITNAGERTLRSKLSVRQSTWESRGGIAGGHVELQDISSCGVYLYTL